MLDRWQIGLVALLPVLNNRADHKQGCCSASDAEDGRRVAERLGIPFYALNLEEEFRDIIDYFVDEYTVGRTPNPCVMCNNRIKFGKLFDYADSVDAEFLATGHYAQLLREDGQLRLTRGVDAGKDQSYVLFGIKQKFLQRMLLPVGGYDKPTIRQIAGTLGLNVAEKKDSQEICFVTSGKHDEFVRQRRGDELASDGAGELAGEIVTTDGTVVGQHPGIERFTIGQSKGLGVAMGEPYFVVRIEPAAKKVVIGKIEELGRSELTASKTNWLVDPSTLQALLQMLIQPLTRLSAWLRFATTALPNRRRRLCCLTIESKSSSMNRKTGSRPAKPSCATTANEFWAAVGLTECRGCGNRGCGKAAAHFSAASMPLSLRSTAITGCLVIR